MDPAHLEVLAGPKIDELLYRCNTQIQSLHRRIIRIHALSVRYNSLIDMKETERKTKMLFETPSLKSSFPVCHFRASVEFVVKEFHNNQKDVALAVINSRNSKDFHELVSRSIPAAFGFFSSKELTDMALAFYYVIVSVNRDWKLTSTIIKPLFTSHVTFRFCECLFTDLFAILDQNNDTSKTASIFINYIIKFMSLLPRQIIDLLKFLSMNLGDKLGHVFFGAFLKPCAEMWLRSSPLRYKMTTLSKLFDFCVTDAELLNRVTDSLRTMNSAFSIPSLISLPERPSMKMLITVSDARNLAKLLETAGLFPEALEITEFTKMAASRNENWLSYRIYFTFRRDSSSGTLEIFEKYTNAQLLIKKLEYYDSLGETYREKVLAACIHKSKEQNSKDTVAYMQKKALSMPNLRKELTLDKLEVIAEPVIKKWSRSLKELDRIQIKKREADDKNMCEISKAIVTAVSSQLENLQGASLYRRYSILVHSFEHIEKLKKNGSVSKEIYREILSHARCTEMLSSIMMVNAFGMWDSKFTSMISERENDTWLKMESSILGLLCDTDGSLLSRFVRIQEQMGLACSHLLSSKQ